MSMSDFSYGPGALPTCLFIAPLKGEGSKIRVRSDAVYKFLVVEAATRAGFRPEFITCDEPVGILNRIVHKIKTCNVLLADITGENGSVCYELAYAHVYQKSTVLLAAADYSVPWDLEVQNRVIYDYDHGGTSLKTSVGELVKHLQHHRLAGFTTDDNPLLKAERASYTDVAAAFAAYIEPPPGYLDGPRSEADRGNIPYLQYRPSNHYRDGFISPLGGRRATGMRAPVMPPPRATTPLNSFCNPNTSKPRYGLYQDKK